MLRGFDCKVCPTTGKVYEVRDGWHRWIWPPQAGGVRCTGSGSGNNKNIAGDGAWGWEEIKASMYNGLSDGVFKATDNYMVVSFAINGNADSGLVHYWVDNVSVHEARSDPTGDWNVGWFDMLRLADEWLDCGLVDGGACLN